MHDDDDVVFFGYCNWPINNKRAASSEMGEREREESFPPIALNSPSCTQISLEGNTQMNTDDDDSSFVLLFLA